MSISNQTINNLVNLAVSSAEFKKNFERANLETLRLAQKESLSETKRAMIDAKVKRLIEEQSLSLSFENNMTETEARDKHTQLKSLHSVARALLLEIRDRKGYLALGFSSFEEYGEKEWGYTRTYINRLANAEVIQKSLSVPIGTKEIPETHLRELGKVPTELRDEIYQQAKAEAEAENKEVTAKLIKEKSDAVKKLKHLDNLYQHQSKNVDKVIKEHSALVEEFNELEASVDAKAEELAAKKSEAKQIEMQKNLDELVAKTEAENQTAISDLKLTISRLTQEKNGLLKLNEQGENIITKIKQTSLSIEQDASYLADLKQEIDEAKAALKQLSLEQKEANATKRANHAYTGIAKALSSDVHDHIENMNSISCLVDESGNAIPLYPLTDDSKDYLQEVARVLRNSAKFLENLAAYTVDKI